MNVDNKLPMFRHYMSDSGCGTKGSKTGTLDTGVASTEQKSVSLGLKQEEERKDTPKNANNDHSRDDSKDNQKNKKDHNLLFLKSSKTSDTKENQDEKNELLSRARKLLNLI